MCCAKPFWTVQNPTLPPCCGDFNSDLHCFIQWWVFSIFQWLPKLLRGRWRLPRNSAFKLNSEPRLRIQVMRTRTMAPVRLARASAKSPAPTREGSRAWPKKYAILLEKHPKDIVADQRITVERPFKILAYYNNQSCNRLLKSYDF